MYDFVIALFSYYSLFMSASMKQAKTSSEIQTLKTTRVLHDRKNRTLSPKAILHKFPRPVVFLKHLIRIST